MEEERKFYTIILRHDTSSEWLIHNPILDLGEYGVEDDTHRVKRGDGVSNWADLPYEHFGLEYLVTFGNLLGGVEDNQALVDALFTKVDKDVAGAGQTILKSSNIIYGSKDGNLILRQEHLSLESGSVTISEQNINVVSENELANTVDNLEAIIEQKDLAINDKVDHINDKLNNRISDEVKTLNNTINDNHKKINDRVSNEVSNINHMIDDLKRSTNNRIDKEVADINATMEQDRINIHSKLEQSVERLNDTISANKDDIETKLKETDTRLTDTINANHNEINARVDKEVAALNDTINKNDEAIHQRVDKEVSTLNETIEGNRVDIEHKLTEADTRINNKIDTIKTETDTTIANLTAIVNENEQDIEAKLAATETRLKENIDINDNEINKRVTNEVATLNETISNNKIEINDRVTNEVSRLDLSIHTEKTALNNRIDNEVATINANQAADKQELQDNIDANKADIENKLASEANKKIDKDIADAIVTSISLATEQGNKIDEPTLKIVSKNTDTETEIVQHLHFVEVGDIEVTVENDHMVIDSTVLDEGIAKNKQDIADLSARHDLEMTTLTNKHNKEMAELTEKHNAEMQAMDEKKVDKTFAAETNNLVVGDVSLLEIENADLAKLNIKSVSPENKEGATKSLKLVSTNNTLISQEVYDDNGNIVAYDLATNLDTDVHYWITTEILSTVIPSETVLDISKMTSTTKQPVEIQDIVSDPEGTWARIQEIDTEANTVTCVTFHKHAQAVWGTVKGNIKEQQDLQEELIKKFSLPTSNDQLAETYLSNKISYSVAGISPTIGNQQYSSNVLVYTQENNFNTRESNPMTPFLRFESDGSPDIVFRSITLSNNEEKLLYKVYAENIIFDKQESGLTSTTIAPAIRELKGLDDKKVLITDFEEFKTANQTALDSKIDRSIASTLIQDVSLSKSGSNRQDMDSIGITVVRSYTEDYHKLSSKIFEIYKSDSVGIYDYNVSNPQRLRFFVKAEGVDFDPQETGLNSVLLAPAIRELKILDDAKVVKTTDANKIYGTDEQGNTVYIDRNLMGNVDTVNDVEPDVNKNVELFAKHIPVEEISEETPFVTLENNIQAQLETLMIEVNNLKKTQYWAQNVWNLDELMAQVADFLDNANLRVGDYVSAISGNGVILMGRIEDLDLFYQTNFYNYGNSYQCIRGLVESGAVALVGIPEQCTEPSSRLNTKLYMDQDIVDTHGQDWAIGVFKLAKGSSITADTVADKVLEFKVEQYNVSEYDPETENIAYILVDKSTGLRSAEAYNVLAINGKELSKYQSEFEVYYISQDVQ